MLFKLIEILGIISRILWRLTFCLGEYYLISVEDRSYFKKMMRSLDKTREEFGKMVNDYSRSGGDKVGAE